VAADLAVAVRQSEAVVCRLPEAVMRAVVVAEADTAASNDPVYFRFFSKKSVVFSSSCLRNSPVTPWLFCG